MSKTKREKQAAEVETSGTLVATEGPGEAASTTASESEKESIVDHVFDTVTAWTAKGLEATKRGLEVSARWLDARAKAVGDLATKLSSA
jgi:hypothetical protein